MIPKVFPITNIESQTGYYKGYVLKYTGQVREKIWCEGVCKTRGEAERQAKKLWKTLQKEKTMC